MGSLGNPKIWVPYENTKDCSQGFCSLHCPQWCYVIFPPPPPFRFPDDDDDSSPNFSPLVIAIIGIVASAFLLVSYYTIISKYCGNMDSSRRENHEPNEELDDINHNPSLHEPWHVTSTGLDEALIKSITVCKYKKGDGLVEGTDCSVCLGEFEEDESLRLLPKCSHAFHLQCIDTWLKSHSNCPLCRANIVCITNVSPLQLPAPPPPPPPPVTESPPVNESSSESQHQNEIVAIVEYLERGIGEEEILDGDVFPKTPVRALSDLEGRDTIIEIKDEVDQPIRRSVSMDYSRQSHVSVADVLRMNQDEDAQMDGVGSSKRSVGEISKCSPRNRVLHCVTSPVAMKRSFSSGRFLFNRHGRGRNAIIPA